MSDTQQEVKLSLKAMINKEKTKVLFAEVDSDLADVLLSFLTLPLGTIVKILGKHYGSKAPVIGSLNSLRKGLADLNDVHFSTKEGKMMLLNPISAYGDECRKLKLNIDDDAQTIKYYRCENLGCYEDIWKNLRMYYGNGTCQCGNTISREIRVSESDTETADDGVFTNKTICFAISDDLRMVPNVSGSVIRNLRSFGITDLDGAEQIIVPIGHNEIIDLLKGSFISKTVLTDLILNKRHDQMDMKSESGTVVYPKDKLSTINSKKITVEVIVRKSTKKILFAIGKENFIDFLFSLLTIPLGGVAHLLGSNTCRGSVYNLYRSIENLNGEEYLKTGDTKSMLLESELPPKYLSKNQIFPLVEGYVPSLYLHSHIDRRAEVFRSRECCKNDHLVSFDDPKGHEGSYVKRPGLFMVADDLTVTPLSMLSSVSVLNELKIPLSDVEEVEIEIGLEEGLNILRASITSTSALTNGLMINRVLMKKPKEEQ